MGQQPIGVAQRRGHQGSQRLGNIGTGHFGQMIGGRAQRGDGDRFVIARGVGVLPADAS
jgi:hypothetical protein